MMEKILIVEGGDITREAMAINILWTMDIPAMMMADVVIVIVTPRNQNVIHILPMTTIIARRSVNAKKHNVATVMTGTVIVTAEAGATTDKNNTTGGGDVEAAAKNK